MQVAPGREVRLRGAYFVTCTGVEKNAAGEVTGLRCTYDPSTRGGDAPDGRKVKATLHWVSAAHALEADVRLCEHLFRVPHPEEGPEGSDFLAQLKSRKRKQLRKERERAHRVRERARERARVQGARACA